jgi:ubiquinone/menaquinone biosynthesis C-methylase UbiE
MSQRSSAKKSKSGIAPGYLHGFDKTEQKRLYRQAHFLEPFVFEGVDFKHCHRLLEVGSGVGAQTEILARRFPDLAIDCVDASPAQLKAAKKHLARQIREKRVRLHPADALDLPFEDNTFDGAFVCWLLEHVAEPVGVLHEIRRVLRQNAMIHIHEVQNASFFVHPYSPATIKYWFEFNDHQWAMKGDPFIGAKLGNYLLAAGFQNIKTRQIVHHYDNRTPKFRAQFIDEWIRLLLSGAPGLLKAGKVDPATVAEMTKELEKLKKDPDSVFYYSWVHASAQAF